MVVFLRCTKCNNSNDVVRAWKDQATYEMHFNMLYMVAILCEMV